GFDHNTHGLRVADLLEDRYPDFPGLNLTNEVRRGIIRHSTPFDLSRMGGTDVPGPWLLEIQTVDLADEIAYDNHDIDDGLKSGLLKESDLRGISLWDDAIVGVRPSSRSSTSDDSVRRNQIIRALINVQVSDVIKNTFEVIKKRGINSIEDVAKQKERTISFSPSMEENRKPLRGVLMNRLYRHYRVVRMSSKASRFLQRLFELYCDTPEQLPPQAQMSIKSVGKHRAICDYLAGMTDRYALDQYKAFFEPYERV
ncbi:MAG TPA: deoxyguanosinetriphosphate triphosphohydrolase, partial [Candidatus Omnitrophota bacterium]|nr:deoxyguanosinetriphosphate triphosphohydrolase [Candidatus Omnitrophota bacterium]